MDEPILFILYVEDQKRSKEFYKNILQKEPILDVQGMTEFKVNEGCLLGLMPEKGIAKILCDAVPDPSSGNGVPRCELYLRVNDPEAYIQRALDGGAKNVSNYQPRNWGDNAGYVCDPDGHIIAFAKST